LGKQFPLASASNRFQVIPANENIVAYVCSGGNLHRTSRSLFPSVTSFPASSCPSSGPVHAQNVICNFDYGGSDLQRNALVSMFIQLTEGGESVSLHHDVHVNNAP
jgi:MSHA biogenesis protein MshO